MQNVPDMTPSPGKFVIPACQTSFGHGYPGRRYIQVAQGFGENATIYSICEPDYTPALNHVIDLIAKQLRTVCLPRPLVRDASGKVACDVLWALPKPENRSSPETPVDCNERPFLSTPAADQPHVSQSGGKICRVTQIAAVGGQLASGDGWYYDNFSDDLKRSCSETTPQRVAFTPTAKPPTGVTVKLQCLNEQQHVANTTQDAIPDARNQIASIGTSCELSPGETGTDPDSLCTVHLANGGVDQSLFCNPQTNTCARSCQGASDCPPAWTCDKRPQVLAATMSAKHPQGSAICVNPTCGL